MGIRTNPLKQSIFDSQQNHLKFNFSVQAVQNMFAGLLEVPQCLHFTVTLFELGSAVRETNFTLTGFEACKLFGEEVEPP